MNPLTPPTLRHVLRTHGPETWSHTLRGMTNEELLTAATILQDAVRRKRTAALNPFEIRISLHPKTEPKT